jgi:hypothetical protein
MKQGCHTHDRHQAREAGGSLSLLAPSPQMRWLLDVLHLDGIFPAAQRPVGPFDAGQRRLTPPGLP